MTVDGLHLVGLEARNVMRVRAVRLEFGERGELVVIGGKNAQGKSSVLSAIEMALGGAGAMPAEPLRKGSGKGTARVVLRDAKGRGYDVERVLTRDGTRLVVTDADGDTMRSPQALLDGLRGALSFDPLEFERLAVSSRQPDRAEAARILRKLLGLDFTDLDEARRVAEQARLEHGRDVKRLEAQLDGMPLHKDAPAEEVSAADLAAELEAANAELARRAQLRTAAHSALDAVVASQNEEKRAEQAVAEARLALAKAERWLSEQKEATGRLQAEAKRIEAEAGEAARAPAPDVDGIRARIAALDESNAKVRANRQRQERRAELDAARAKHEAAQAVIDDVEEQRRAMLAGAEWPIPGMGFGEDGLVRMNGLPFEQASQAERIRASLSIGARLNPRLRLILVREGSMLDDDALRMVAEMAAEHDVTVLLERVGKGEEVQVVIEDGEVAEDRRHVEGAA